MTAASSSATKVPHRDWGGYTSVDRKYWRSDKGKAARKRYNDTAKAKRMFKRAHWLRLYGITRKQYERMLMLQHGVCAVCGAPPPEGGHFDVDHAHDETKRVRCLVCKTCNRSRIGANTVESARRVLEILESDFDGRKL